MASYYKIRNFLINYSLRSNTYKIKRKVFPGLIKHHAMKMYWVVEV
jgi:hypothetical protein